MTLSLRAQETAKPDPGMVLWTVLQNLWHPETNPSGYVSLGVAENTLMHNHVLAFISNNLTMTSHDLTYGDGSKRLRTAMARFLTEQLAPTEPLVPEHILLTNGCSSAIEQLSWSLANPDEAFLLGQPYYGTFLPDVTLRTGVSVVPVPFGDTDPLSAKAADKYEAALLESQAKGVKIAGLILCNPHNPLGRCYSREAILRLMALCEKYECHLVSDEIYALSVWENTVDKNPPPVPFTSCLSLLKEGFIDPSRLHVVWGMSKDFGANGIRLGAIISQHNPQLHAALVPISLYSSISSLSQNLTTAMLEDKAWHTTYLIDNRKKLAANYKIVASWAQENGVPYMPGVNAAFFLWVDLGAVYRRRHLEAAGDIDEVIMQALMEKRIFLASGKTFGSEAKGWFRIVFSQDQTYLQEGLKRIVEAVGPLEDELAGEARRKLDI